MWILIVAFLWWQLMTITVVSSGYHRYFSHRAFKAPVWYEYYVLSMGTLTGAGPLLGWAGVHRLHHRYSDSEKDPHSPRHKGFWNVLLSKFEVPNIPRKSIIDLLKNKRVMFFYRWHKWIRISSFIVGFLVLPFWLFAIIFLFTPVMAHIGFGAINVFAHDRKNGGAKNSHLLNIIAGGDGFHKNHHDSPNDWKIGTKWYEFDPGAWFISVVRIY